MCGTANHSGKAGRVRGRLVALCVLAAVAVAVPAGAAPAAAAPQPAAAGTLGRSGGWVTDLAGRVITLHGTTLPIGALPGPADAQGLAGQGFDAVRLRVAFDAKGLIVGIPADMNIGGQDAPLDTLAASVGVLWANGIQTLIALEPQNAAARPTQYVLADAITNVARRFVGVTGLVGIEVNAPAGSDPGLLTGAVRQVDTHHLLWRDGTAPFAPTIGVAVNAPAAIITGWSRGTLPVIAQIVNIADNRKLGWLYSADASGPGAATLRRIYPAAITGTPTSFAYDPGTRRFQLAYDTARAAGGVFGKDATTQISIPPGLFANGYVVTVTGATVVSKPNAGDICLANQAGAMGVTVAVAPAATSQPVTVAPSRGLAGCSSGVVVTAGVNAGNNDPNAPVESTVKAKGGFTVPVWVYSAGGTAIVVLLVSAVVVLRRRKKADDDAPDVLPFL